MNPPGMFPWTEAELAGRLHAAVVSYWEGRLGQSDSQRVRRSVDKGTRGEVTGGKHLDGVLALIIEVAQAAGYSEEEIKTATGVDLPGYFRSQKRWDLVVIREGRICAAVELKSQVGSFGKNFNNRSEEAIGNATDFWVAFREGRLGRATPWLGYFFFLEHAEESTRPVALKKSLFPPFPVFEGTSYARRYTILCERLVLEQKYTRTALVMSPRGAGPVDTGADRDLGFHGFLKSLHGHLLGCR